MSGMARTSETSRLSSSSGQLPRVGGDDDRLRDPKHFLNRELSYLEFNRRVLAQALNPALPLLERLRFLCIASTNLDEFFEIRAAGLKQQLELGVSQPEADGSTPQETLARVSVAAHQLVGEQYRVLNEVLIPALEAAGIRIVRRETWTPEQSAFLEEYFLREVLPVLTPVGLDPSHPFPRVLNKGLCVIVALEGEDAYHRSGGTAVVQVPRALPRLIALPAALAGSQASFVLLSSVIHAHVGRLFPGMRITACHQFRVTRNSDLWVHEEEVDDLLRALKGELPQRKFGDPVRLEVAETCPPETVQFLLDQFGLGPADLYAVSGPVNLHRLAALYELVDRPDLKYPAFIPGTPRRLQGARDVFEAVRQGDVLLHHPYESFSPVLELLRQAATDPDVLAIKQTLYRIGNQSPVADALIEAARAGKEVTAVIELRARFDEAANIDLATRLQEVGANVAYGIVGMKTHAKLLMVVRKEAGQLRRYVHLGTGNYHAATTRTYTDLSLLSCDPRLGEDVHRLFQQLTGLGRAPELRHLWHSPFTLQAELLRLIEEEAARARKGEPARIVARMNGLSEPAVIRALYRASQAGVQIDLIVRGICCLRPGVPGLSETIRVRSVVGRFLEHGRVFFFHAGGEQRTYCSSADWMERNLHRRVEVAFPILDPELRARAVDEALSAYLDDDAQAWELQADGGYRPSPPAAGTGTQPFSAQEALLTRLAGRLELRPSGSSSDR